MKFETQESAGYLVNHLARLFAAQLQSRIRPLGISVGQFPALLALWAEDGLTQKQLVERLDVEQATMANTLVRMERDGLVERRPHPEDARSSQVWLTARGRAVQSDAIRAATLVNRLALAPLSRREQSQFLELMRRVLHSWAGPGPSSE